METQKPRNEHPRFASPPAFAGEPRARAIEVVALFEDAIVDARHFADPAAGRITPKTRALAIGGAVALGLAATLFFVAYVVVGHEGTAGGTASGSGRLLDALTVLLIAGGASAIAWSLSRRQEEQVPRDYTIGSDPRALFQVPDGDLPAASFPLLHSTGSEYQLLFTAGMQGDLTVGDCRRALGDLIKDGSAQPSIFVPGAFACAIPDTGRARIDFGDTTVLLRPVAAPRRQGVPVRFDWKANGYTIAVGAVTLFILAGLFSVPADATTLAVDEFSAHRFATIVLRPVETPPEEVPAWMKQAPKEPGGKPAPANKGPSGKMGRDDLKQKTNRYAIKGDKNNMDKHLAKELAREAVRNAGALGVLTNAGSRFSSIFSNEATAMGDAANDAFGGLVGIEVGDASGVPGGLGLVGGGHGGDFGPGMGTVGLARIGTRGIGDGSNHYGSGPGLARMIHRPAGPGGITMGQVQTRGTLDASIIRRVIRQHLNEVRFCYEQALAKKSDLYGRLLVRFTIGGTGQVLSALAENSTLSSPPMEACTTQAVRRWEFPKPQNGGIVIVGYPFTFNRPGASD